MHIAVHLNINIFEYIYFSQTPYCLVAACNRDDANSLWSFTDRHEAHLEMRTILFDTVEEF